MSIQQSQQAVQPLVTAKQPLQQQQGQPTFAEQQSTSNGVPVRPQIRDWASI